MTLIRDHLWSSVKRINVSMVGLLMDRPELGIHGINSSLLQACAINRHDLVDVISRPRANYEVWRPKSIPMDEVNKMQKKFEENVKTSLNINVNPFELIYEGDLVKQG